MIKKIVGAALLFVLCAAALFAADRLYCKWCGSSNFANVRQLASSACSRSPTGKHEPYAGAPRRFYVCTYCATESASFEQLVLSPCSKSPRRYHDAYEGAEKAAYACRHCGFESRSFRQLVVSPCGKSPRGYHDAL
ncbi:MAG: phage terminase large subunit family protein [Treponema sp.]|jgi:hypothetical protein|nr:phage terminase large subunit family protein [Treponema sp.]